MLDLDMSGGEVNKLSEIVGCPFEGCTSLANTWLVIPKTYDLEDGILIRIKCCHYCKSKYGGHLHKLIGIEEIEEML